MNRVTFRPVADASEWDARVAVSRTACAFHSSDWKRSLNAAFPQYRGEDFWVERGGERVGGWSGFVFAPFPFVSVREAGPWNLFGGYLPFAEDAMDAAILGAWEAEARRRGTCRLTLTPHPDDFSLLDSLLPELGFRRVTSKTTHVLDLPDNADDLWKGVYKGSVRTDVRKSRNASVTVRRTTNAADIRAFYAIYAATMERFGSLAKPETLVRNLVASPVGALWVAEREGRVVAGLFALRFARTVTIWMAASAPEERRYAPNHALYHAALEDAIAQGYWRVDFGASPPENRGLVAFKESFGASARTFGTYRKVLAPVRDALWERAEPLARWVYGVLTRRG
jgi:hypothetical protein